MIKCPDAWVGFRGREIPAVARLLEGAERERAWAAALALWPPYATYQGRAERVARLFRLIPRE